MNASNISLDPNRLTIEQVAQVLSTTGRKVVSADVIERDIAAGAPTNADGTINLVQYGAWLAMEMGRGG